MERKLQQMRMLETAVGTIHSRGPGLRGTAEYLLKRVTRRLLAWYTRSLHQFHLTTTRVVEEQANKSWQGILHRRE